MTDSFVTQCPHCQTSFRVTHQQLSVARGVVRCGHCLQVFNAAKQLLEQNRAAPGPAAEQPAAAPLAPTTAPEPSPSATPAVAKDDWTLTAQALDELDLDQELARLERRGERTEPRAEALADNLQARRDEPVSDQQHDVPFGTASDDAHEPEAPEEPMPLLLDEQPPEVQADARTEPTLGARLDLDLDDPAPTPVRTDAASTARFDDNDDDMVHGKGLSARDDDSDSHLSADHDELHQPEPGERLEPGLAARPERPTRKEPLVDVVDDPLQLGWEKPAPNWGKRLLWGTLTLLAAALLAFQYVWFHFDEMARQDQYRPLFQQLCPVLGCEVPTRVDIGRIKSSNLVVRSHPDFNGALIVDAIIYNRAPFAQPFPLLELRFADLNGQLIASRRFKPSEYLSGELAGRGEMPSQTPIHIALDILDPGPKAVNYSLSFRSPE
ncbi:DUF3426 domain-containing protein [Pseudomonas sp. SMSB3]|uniref:DUF3426 domain-containing protein n=1 Tax=Pseudomonas sp. SMSB3 TaxID=3390196 RepID=UPI003F86F886